MHHATTTTEGLSPFQENAITYIGGHGFHAEIADESGVLVFIPVSQHGRTLPVCQVEYCQTYGQVRDALGY